MPCDITCFLPYIHEISLNSICITRIRKYFGCNFKIKSLTLHHGLFGHFGTQLLLFYLTDLSPPTPTHNQVCQVSDKVMKLSPLFISLPHASSPGVLKPLSNKAVACLLCFNRFSSLHIRIKSEKPLCSMTAMETSLPLSRVYTSKTLVPVFLFLVM